MHWKTRLKFWIRAHNGRHGARIVRRNTFTFIAAKWFHYRDE